MKIGFHLWSRTICLPSNEKISRFCQYDASVLSLSPHFLVFFHLPALCSLSLLLSFSSLSISLLYLLSFSISRPLFLLYLLSFSSNSFKIFSFSLSHSPVSISSITLSSSSLHLFSFSMFSLFFSFLNSHTPSIFYLFLDLLLRFSILHLRLS